MTPDGFDAYCDESYTSGQYRSIACVSLPTAAGDAISQALARHLAGGPRELKWSRTGADGQCARAALKFICTTFDALASRLRVDVLVWDTHDRRHAIPGRDDRANFERMFFQLLAATLKQGTPGSTWRVYCDEKVGVDWGTLHECLQARGRRRETQAAMFKGLLDSEKYFIREWYEVHSEEYPMVQMSDLFAGLSVFSRVRYGGYAPWHDAQLGQLALFSHPAPVTSRADGRRFAIMQYLDERIRSAGLGVSLATHRGFRTMDPREPINLWWYEPQHDRDRAPTTHA